MTPPVDRIDRLAEMVPATLLIQPCSQLLHSRAARAHDDMADDLWIDRAMLLARIRALDTAERAYIELMVERQERVA